MLGTYFGSSHSLVSVLQHLNAFQRVSVGLLVKRMTAWLCPQSQVSWPQSSVKPPQVSISHPSKGAVHTATTNAVHRHKGLHHMGQRSWHAVPRYWKRRVRKHCCWWLIFVLEIRPYAKTFCFVRPNTIIFDIWFQTQENWEETGENFKYFSLPEGEQAFILASAEYFCLHSITHRWVA